MQADEQLICDYLLKIFRSTVIAMPKTSSKFAGNLQAALLPMLNRPSSNLTVSSASSVEGSVADSPAQTLQEIVSCFCAVVRGQTHDFTKMIVVLKACAGEFALSRSPPSELIRRDQVDFKARSSSSKTLRLLRAPTCACSRLSATSPPCFANTATLTRSAARSQVRPPLLSTCGS